jgi:hypothetical protein
MMSEPIAQDAFCTCGHRALFHEGRRLTCVMAGCQSCKGFDLAPVKAEWIEETPTPTATMTAHGHSHKRMTLTVKYDTDRHFPVYLWLKDGKPCEGC